MIKYVPVELFRAGRVSWAPAVEASFAFEKVKEVAGQIISWKTSLSNFTPTWGIEISLWNITIIISIIHFEISLVEIVLNKLFPESLPLAATNECVVMQVVEGYLFNVCQWYQTCSTSINDTSSGNIFTIIPIMYSDLIIISSSRFIT